MQSRPAYRSLVAWQRADDLLIRLHLLARERFPREERHLLAPQLIRAALSVPANIVEGTARSSRRESLHFLRIAWASLLEAGYYVHVAHRLGYLDRALLDDVEVDIRRTAAPLRGLMERYRGGGQ